MPLKGQQDGGVDGESLLLLSYPYRRWIILKYKIKEYTDNFTDGKIFPVASVSSCMRAGKASLAIVPCACPPARMFFVWGWEGGGLLRRHPLVPPDLFPLRAEDGYFLILRGLFCFVTRT